MNQRHLRAQRIDRIMTIVFYGVAIFFMLLLAAFAGKVIIGGLIGAKPEMFAFAREGSVGNQFFNTIYLVFIALLFSVPVGIFAGIYLAIYAKQGPLTKFLRVCIETLSSLPSIVVGLFGYLVFLVFMGLDKSLLAGGCLAWFAARLFSRQCGAWRNEMAIGVSCALASKSFTYYDRGDLGGWAWLW